MFSKRLSFIILAGLFVFLLSSTNIWAKTFVVNSEGDDSDNNINTTCETADGNGICTLRAAIEEANGHAGEDSTITFDSSLEGKTIVIGSPLEITKRPQKMTIQGPGADKLTVDGNGADNVFYIDADGSCMPYCLVDISGLTVTGALVGIHINNMENDVTLDGVTITDNKDPGAGDGMGILSDCHALTIKNSTISKNISDNYAGGIYNGSGDLTIQDSTISENESISYAGGIYNGGGTVDIQNSTISGNSSNEVGGIYHDGVLTIKDSTVSENEGRDYAGGIYNGGGTVDIQNSTISGNSSDYGAGILNENGQMSLEASTVSDNVAGMIGGGISSGGIGSIVEITNSTISGNRSYGDGAGIANYNTGGPEITIINSTITHNTADYDPNGDGDGDGDGGGIWCQGGGDSNDIVLVNTIVAGNMDNSPDSEAPDCFADSHVNSVGNNIIGIVDGCTGHDFDDSTKNDLYGTTASPVDAKLAPLAANSTATHVPMDGSPAIDRVDENIIAPYETPDADQRGTDRPQGIAADIGAVETTCGDGEVQGDEQCDDGNTADGDDCSSTCEDGPTKDDGGGCSLIVGSPSGSALSLGWFAGMTTLLLGLRRRRS